MEEFIDSLKSAHNEVVDAILAMAGVPAAASGDDPAGTPAQRSLASLWASISSGPGVLDGVRHFVDAVDWSEPWFCFLAGFHLLVYLVAFAFAWRSSTRIIAMMVFLFVAVALTEQLNSFGSATLSADPRFFRQTETVPTGANAGKSVDELAEGEGISFEVRHGTNYFDKGGIFVSVTWAGPLLALAFLLQVKLLWDLVRLMVVIKRRQLQEEARQARAGGTSNNATGRRTLEAGSKKKQKKKHA